jgi:hypothetical protein
MAVDTRDRRSSAIDVSSPWRSKLPTPDGTIAAADRQHAAGYYSGILATGAIADDSGTRRQRQLPAFTLRRRRRC